MINSSMALHKELIEMNEYRNPNVRSVFYVAYKIVKTLE